MRWILCALAALLAAPLLAGDRGDRADCIGGTVSGLRETTGVIDVTNDQTMSYRSGQFTIAIPYTTINVLEYGQKVDRRYLMAVAISPLLLLSKKRQHFLTVGYTDDEDRQQALVFQVDKKNIRSVLASLEARTGRKVAYQDLEARRAGGN